jgi:hypothetical protein
VNINTATLGIWNYTIQYNDSVGLWGEPDMVLINITDQTNPWDNNPPDRTYEVGSEANITYRLQDNIGGGFYRVLREGSPYIGWTPWLNNQYFNVSIDTSSFGIWNYTIQYNDSVGLWGVPDQVEITIDDQTAPWDNDPKDDAYQQYIAVNITWTLSDNYAGGFYRVLRNESTHVDWSPWTANSSYDVNITTSTLGIWNYTIQYNDSYGLWGTPDEVWITILDYTNPWDDDPPDATYVKDALANITYTLSDNGDGGFYRVLLNHSLHVDWTPWLANSSFDIWVNTTTAGIWNYTIEYNDSAGLWGTPDTVWITIDGFIPWDSSPAAPSFPKGSDGTFTFTLYDDVGGGYYRVLRESVEVEPWQSWTSGELILITMDTSTVGTWNYTIQYNDSVGLSGDPIMLTVEVESAGGGIPGFTALFGILGLIYVVLHYSSRRKPSN